MTTWWPFARLAAALLGIAAIVAQLSLTLQIALEATTPWGGHLPTVAVNFFSFFTILSNVSAAIALIIAAAWALGQRDPARPEPRWLSVLLVCVSTYMIVTGVVYNLLLRGIELPQGVTVPWSNEVLHVVFPLFLLLDVLVAPRQRALPWSTVLVVAVFPVVWVAYTLIRANLVIAPATGASWWYPYPFLDPHLQGGYGGVLVYVIGIAVAIILIATVVVWIGRRRGTARSEVHATSDSAGVSSR
ncbi:Pr6Pr family membrane protein [Microbacterium esteraromaticum]|uniref:Pr6Pr family membrane protein n=1 Tax=Microbacterium esteraromaticum TaxID=57043 RepID=UPI0019D3B62B|nr:Pr6Pr family membrane protein [Microbacterium esteraromaticum]MBN7793933.1 Pr6Pr family membrane protein [Microbacterium esteraromaticum]